ncbi:MAG: hypothetical protein RLZZ123_1896 [Pseudomonadota bacterium]|jgi:hypothetical protein
MNRSAISPQMAKGPSDEWPQMAKGPSDERLVSIKDKAERF